jgi:hypothetical protein
MLALTLRYAGLGINISKDNSLAELIARCGLKFCKRVVSRDNTNQLPQLVTGKTRMDLGALTRGKR